jgi:uncharacterized membrane protein
MTGAAIHDPSSFGLDFAILAIFVALLVSLARGKGTSIVLPWGLAAGVAIATHALLPGNWYVLLGAVAGALPAVSGRARACGVLPAIIGTALVTYATRASGLLLGRRLSVPPWLDNVLRAMPGAIIVSLVAPEIVSADIPGAVAGVATVGVAVAMRDNLIVPMTVGVLVDIGLRLVR